MNRPRGPLYSKVFLDVSVTKGKIIRYYFIFKKLLAQNGGCSYGDS